MAVATSVTCGAAIDVNGCNFADVWEAIAANNPYAVEFAGDDADDAKDDAETAIPVMFADHMLDVAVIGNLYYAIIGVDVDQPLQDFISDELGIDVQQNLEDERVVRAGTTRSRISRQDRVVERHDLEVRNGVLWQSFDFNDDANESIFEDPFGFAAGGTEAIFTLPNGMLGYIIADEDDNIVEDSDILLDTNQNDGDTNRARTKGEKGRSTRPFRGCVLACSWPLLCTRLVVAIRPRALPQRVSRD